MLAQLPDDDTHVLTVDLEEYFESPALEDILIPEEWPSLPSRVELAVDRLLDLLAENEATATFFVSHWVADRHPRVVERIADAGHEIASGGRGRAHGTGTEGAPVPSRIRTFRGLLETLDGRPVLGHRPGFSRGGAETDEVLSLFVRAGYRYVSWREAAPWSDAGRERAGRCGARLTRTRAGPILELPLASLDVFGLNLPVSCRPSLRHVPMWAVRRGLDSCGEKGRPGVLSLKSWEVDEHQPRFSLPPMDAAMQYGRIGRTASRLGQLLEEYRFASVRECYGLDEEPVPEASRVGA